ncbi:MAG: phosphatidylserine decarboxylase family protein [Deltaproteobacteria bacterium]|nr:phosphatidylserine decarboxylase family protein [Deltaproteobacteria bacterium]
MKESIKHRKFIFLCTEGLYYIGGLGVLCVACTIVAAVRQSWSLMGMSLVMWLLFIEFCYFFRDPERDIPQIPAEIVAPADGRVISIKPMKEETFLRGEALRVSIFMNIFSVHVNRSPIAGEITYFSYNPGKFISAFKEKASLDNEQVSIGIEGGEGEKKDGRRVLVRLIAGLIARRIVLWKGKNDRIDKGERMSIIKFGSRVDIYLPLDADVLVSVGDHVTAGESVVALYGNSQQ